MFKMREHHQACPGPVSGFWRRTVENGTPTCPNIPKPVGFYGRIIYTYVYTHVHVHLVPSTWPAEDVETTRAQSFEALRRLG